MGYCSLNDIEKILSQTLTGANPTQSLAAVPSNLTSIGRKIKARLVTEDDANYYIRLAASHINAALSQQYVTPLQETCDFETKLTANVDEYVDALSLYECGDLNTGDILVLTDGDNEEKVEVETVEGLTVTLKVPSLNLYDLSSTRVMRIKFPDPIPFIAARLAAATIYDKYATAQSEPGKTEFGQLVRKEAFDELDNIREGRTILFGAQRRGWRFANPNLLDRYTVKGSFEQDSTRSSGQSKG